MVDKSPLLIFEQLNKIDFSIVYYKLAKAGFDEKKIVRMQRETLRYLALCAANTVPEKKFTPSPLVDEFWHQMILCTHQYRTDVFEACGIFLDHLPNKNKEQKKYNDEFSFWNTIDDYEKFFGEPDLEIWGLSRREEVTP